MGRFLFVVFLLGGPVRANPTVLKLNDGSVIKGEVIPPSPTATEVVVSTDYGIIRVPVAKISPESREAAGIAQPATMAQYDARIARLKARIKELKAERAEAHSLKDEEAKRAEAHSLKDEEAKRAEAQRLKDEEAKRAEAQRLKDEEDKRKKFAEEQPVTDEQAKILPVKILLAVATAKGGYPCTGFIVEELDGKGRKIDPQKAAAGFEVQRGSRWKVTLTGDLYGEKDKALATVMLPFPEAKDPDKDLKAITILLPPALAEIQVVNKYDSADYTQIKIAGPARSSKKTGAHLATAHCSLKTSDLTPEPALLNPQPQPFPDHNKPLRIPVAGSGQWNLACAGSRVLDDKPLPPVSATSASPVLLDAPPPLSGTYTLVTPMTRFPDGPDNPKLETTKDNPVKEKDGNNYEVDYFNRLVYLLPQDDKSARDYRVKFKNALGRNAELPHFLCVFMELDLKTGKDGKMTVLLTYPQVGFIQYQGDLSAEKNPDGTLKLTSMARKGFAGQAEHPGITAWAADYGRTIRAKDAASLKKFMLESLADWATYQAGTLQKESLLNFSKWDYVDDDNTFRFEVEPRNGTLAMKKALQVYRKKDLYDDNEQYKEPFPVGSVFLKESADMTRTTAIRK